MVVLWCIIFVRSGTGRSCLEFGTGNSLLDRVLSTVVRATGIKL